ncbi:uncharacterized protein LOC125546599 [Triticum urartu]|uniref:uncharacterized protein LOC125546599 n=1 Tax=Triticum urartu TaxID=4572 RepID=UPI002042E54D|nr:uncharacterized protein LOC125546599 [Triticum urartu]
MAMAGSDQAAGWMMLDRFVYRRDEDGDGGFPDESTAPLRATSSTSLGRPFDVAILHAEPPAVSRLYVRWPGGTKGKYGSSAGTALMAAHRDLILFQLVSMEGHITHDHFVCIASSDPAAGPHMELKRLPVCTIPMVLPPCSCEEQDTEEETPSCEEEDTEDATMRRVFFPNTLGLIRGREEEFAVAQLAMVTKIRGAHRMEAEVCVLRSRVSDPDDHGMWELQKIPVQHQSHEYLALDNWLTDAVVTFNNYICWISYYAGGILFYDIFAETPNIFYLRLPTSNRPTTTQERGFLEVNRSLCVTGDLLKYTYILRNDKRLYGPLKPRTGFTILTDTLSITETGDINCFHERVKIANELWHYNTSECLPRQALMYPLVSMDSPNIVHYLISEEGDKIDKVSMVTLDMITQKVISIVSYIKGEEDLCGQDADMVKEKSHLLASFLPSEFPKFLNLTRY